MKFSVYGAGAWGTTLAIHIANCGHSVTLVPRRQEHAQAILEKKENAQYLPGFSTEKVVVSADPEDGLEVDVAFIACPSKGLEGLAGSLKPLVREGQCPVFLSLCKGLDAESFLTPSQYFHKILGDEVACGVFSGPNLAAEIAQGKPAASTLAIDHKGVDTQAIQKALSNEKIRIYTSSDVLGVEFASCLKNIYAIGAGILDALELGYNAKSSYLTRAMAELIRIGETFGGHVETFYGLSGFGDLMATCSSPKSRNYSFGQVIASGKSPLDVINSQLKVVEGYRSTKAFYDFCKEKGIRAPILEQLYCVLYEDKSPQAALVDLMTRDLRAES